MAHSVYLSCGFTAVFKTYMVIIPLIVNVTGFFISLLMRPIGDRIGKKVYTCLYLYIVFLTLQGQWENAFVPMLHSAPVLFCQL